MSKRSWHISREFCYKVLKDVPDSIDSPELAGVNAFKNIAFARCVVFEHFAPC